MNNNGFFKILISVCSGTKCFYSVSGLPALKSLLHLFMLAVICSLLFSAVSSGHIRRSIDNTCFYLQKQFGSILVKKDGIYPEIAPQKPKSVSFNYLQIDYLPDSAALAKFSLNTDLNYSGFIWTPRSVTGWLKMGDRNIIAYDALTDLTNSRFFDIITRDSIGSYILKYDILKSFNRLILRLCAQTDIPIVGGFLISGNTSFMEFSTPLFYWSTIIVLVRFFLTVFFNAVFYSLIFAAIYSFTWKEQRYSMTFKRFFVMAVYASFPGIIIGTLLELAQPPWFDYQTIFIVAFVVYLITITSRLKTQQG